jgi:hypothetical protein
MTVAVGDLCAIHFRSDEKVKEVVSDWQAQQPKRLLLPWTSRLRGTLEVFRKWLRLYWRLISLCWIYFYNKALYIYFFGFFLNGPCTLNILHVIRYRRFQNHTKLILCFVDRASWYSLITRTNLIHCFHFIKTQSLTCFGHHLPILRRHYTNTVLVGVACCTALSFNIVKVIVNFIKLVRVIKQRKANSYWHSKW